MLPRNNIELYNLATRNKALFIVCVWSFKAHSTHSKEIEKLIPDYVAFLHRTADFFV